MHTQQIPKAITAKRW